VRGSTGCQVLLTASNVTLLGRIQHLVHCMTMLAKVLNDGTAICTERTDKRFNTRVNELMSDKLSTHCELLETNITCKCFLTVTSHVTTQSFHRCTTHTHTHTHTVTHRASNTGPISQYRYFGIEKNQYRYTGINTGIR